MIIKENKARQVAGALETARRDAKAAVGGSACALAGPVYIDRSAQRVPRKMQQGNGAPSMCWICGRQLQRAPGKGLGLFYFNRVRDRGGVTHRVHGDCTKHAFNDDCVIVSEFESKREEIT